MDDFVSMRGNWVQTYRSVFFIDRSEKATSSQRARPHHVDDVHDDDDGDDASDGRSKRGEASRTPRAMGSFAQTRCVAREGGARGG
jgi:hypothetical protein